MKMMAPNIARPITKPSVLATRNTAERNRLSGMIGLRGAALLPDEGRQQRDARRPAGRRSTAEPQAYSLPPHVVTRMSALTPAVSSVAPR